MHCLKYEKNEYQNDIVSKVSGCFSEIGLSDEEADIDWVHPIGKLYKNEGSGLTMKSVIIKFKSWRYRQDIYRNRDLKMAKRNQTKILLAFQSV